MSHVDIAIQLTRERNGHNVAGKAMSDGGLTIDLGGMRSVSVDPQHHLVHVDGGCLLGDVDAATAPHGLIVPAGIMSETGVPGPALGGGIGWFSRKHGLNCDQFVSLEVVLASGEVIGVSAGQHPDLFWHAALKHDIPALPFVPPELVGARLLMLISMWLDDADDLAGAELVDRLGAVGRPCLTASTVLPFGAAVQKLLDAEFPDGQRYYTKEAHVSELAGEAIDTLVDFWKDMPMHGEVEIIGLGGAIGDVPEDATAFSNRQYLLWLNFAMAWNDPGNDSDYISRTRKAVRDLEPWTGRGVYVNMLNFDEMDRVVEAYGGPEKYARLGRVKAQYDPASLFQMNYNVTPVPAGS